MHVWTFSENLLFNETGKSKNVPYGHQSLQMTGHTQTATAYSQNKCMHCDAQHLDFHIFYI